MKTARAYISIICATGGITYKNLQAICKRFGTDIDITVAGNEILIGVPDGRGLGFSLNELRDVVKQGRIDMFNLDVDADGYQSRWWYCLP